jgi:hypothetical protein
MGSGNGAMQLAAIRPGRIASSLKGNATFMRQEDQQEDHHLSRGMEAPRQQQKDAIGDQWHNKCYKMIKRA